MVTIRRTLPDDAPLLPAIERSAGEAFRTVPALAWIADDDVMPEARHRALIEAGFAWVAVDAGDHPIGFLSGEPLDDALHILEISVSRPNQGRGIGRRLIEHAREAAIEAGMAAMTLTTFRNVPWNEPFYRTLGFRTLEAGEMPAALRRILAEEIEAGLPGDMRCAMRCALQAAPSGPPWRGRAA